MPDLIELPWPPSLNNLYPTGRNGRRFLSKEGRAYKQRVIYTVRSQRWHSKTITIPVAFSVWVFPPDRRVRDISNLIKIIEDSLTAAGVWKDDSQAYELHVYKRHIVKSGRVDVDVRPMAELAP